MKAERTQVFVPSGEIRFPSLCPKCLGNTDLIGYTSKWKTSYIREWPTKVTRTAEIAMPICRSCKKALMRKERTDVAKAFAFLAPLTWGIGLLCWIVPSVGKYITSLLGRLWLLGIVLEIIWIILGVFALILLLIVIWPHISVEWPIKLEKHHFRETKLGKEWIDSQIVGGNTFSFENETYAKPFEAANPGSYIKPILPK